MCVLHITSESYSFVEIASRIDLPILKVKEKGAQRLGRPHLKHSNNCISLNVSTAEWNDFGAQVADSIDFLNRYSEQLRELLACSEDIEGCLDFPIFFRAVGEIVCQSDHLPGELVSLAGKLGLGIMISSYRPELFDDGEEDSQH